MADIVKLLLTGSSLLPTTSHTDSSRSSGLLASFTSPNGILSSGKNGNSSTSRKSFFKSLLSSIVNKALDKNKHNATTTMAANEDGMNDDADEISPATPSSLVHHLPNAFSQLRHKFNNFNSSELFQPQKKPFYTSSWLKLYKGNATATADKMIDAAVGVVRKSLLLHEDDEQCSRTVNYPQFDRYMCIVAACIIFILIVVQWIGSRKSKLQDEPENPVNVIIKSGWPPSWWKTWSRACRISFVWPVDLRRTTRRLPYTLAFVYSSFSVFRVLSSKHPIDKHEVFSTDNTPNIFDLPITTAIPHYMRTTFVVINVIVLAFKYSPLFLCVEYEALPALGTFIGLIYTSILVSVDTLALVKPCIEFTVMNNFENPFFLDYMLFFAPILVASWCLLLWYVCIWFNTCTDFLCGRKEKPKSTLTWSRSRKIAPITDENVKIKPIQDKSHILYASEVAYTKNLLCRDHHSITSLESRRTSHANLLEQWPIRTFRLDKLFYACKTRPVMMALLIFVYKWIITAWLLYKPHRYFRFSLRFLASVIIACVLVYAVATALFLSLYHTFSDVWPVVLDKQFQQKLLSLTDKNLVDYLTNPRDTNNFIEHAILQEYRPTQLLSRHRALNVTERHQALVGDVRELFVGISVVMRSLVPKYWQPLTAQLHEILRTQIEVVAWVALVTWTLVSCSFVFIIFDLCAHHRRNMLCAYRGDYSRFRCYRNVNRMTTMAGSIRYMGYQTAYLLWSFIIQLGCAFAVLLVLAELIVLPVIYDYWRITNFIVNTIVPLMLVTCFLWYLMLAVSPFFIRYMYNDNANNRIRPHKNQLSVVIDTHKSTNCMTNAMDDESSRRSSRESTTSSTASSVLAMTADNNDNKFITTTRVGKSEKTNNKGGAPKSRSLSNDKEEENRTQRRTITINRIRSNKTRTTALSENNNAIFHTNEHINGKSGHRIKIYAKNRNITSCTRSAYRNEMAQVSLDNLRAYHIFAYYMFFSNAVIGLGSCFLRICKFSFLGLFYLGRLDRSSLPKNFEFIDKGHLSYVSFMKIEATYTHPVMLAFISLLERQQRERFYALNASEPTLEQQQQQQTTAAANIISLNDDKNQCKSDRTTESPSHCNTTKITHTVNEKKTIQHDNDITSPKPFRFHLKSRQKLSDGGSSGCSSVSSSSIISGSPPTNVLCPNNAALSETPLPTVLNFLPNLKTFQQKQRARTRWLLAYTLVKNPSLTALRKTQFAQDAGTSTNNAYRRESYVMSADRSPSFELTHSTIKPVSTQATLLSDSEDEEEDVEPVH